MNPRIGLGLIFLLTATSPLSADERDCLRFIVRLNPVPADAGGAPGASAARVAHHQTPADDRLFAQTSELTLAGASLIRFYQLFISPQDASACPFEPTCSEYAKQAVYTYGFAAGVVMAADRLQRCHGLGGRFYPRDPDSGRLIDPP